jgi:hypothetical protein
MEKIYSFNTESCTYEEVQKPFLMHNLLLLTLMFTSVLFFLLSCYYHAENQKTLELAPSVAKNCYSEVEQLKAELFKQKQHFQLLANTKFIMKNSTLQQPLPPPTALGENHLDLAYYTQTKEK